MKSLIYLLTLILLFSSTVNAADDIAITDAKLNFYDLSYKRMPLSQAQGLTFIAYFDNISNFNHTGIYVNLVIVNSSNDTIYDNDSPVIVVNALSTDSVQVTAPFNAPLAGNYTFLYHMFQDSADAIPSNNELAQSISVHDYLYQRDDGTYTGSNSWMGTTAYYETGNKFEFIGPCQITSASVVVDANSSIGSIFYFSLYDGTYNFIDYTEDYIVTAADLGDTVTVFFSAPINVSALEYYIINAASYGVGDFQVQMAQPAPGITSFYVDDVATWFYSPTTPMIRLNVDETGVNIPEPKEASFNLFPNPAANLLQISHDSPTSEIVIIRDLTGKIVLQSRVSDNQSIDVSYLSSGPYIVSVGDRTKKLIIE